jgi:hypothetical protein
VISSGFVAEAIDWSAVEAVDDIGIAGRATIRTKHAGDTRIRLIDFGADYLNDWCAKGHLVFVVSGTMLFEREDGSRVAVHAGQSYHIPEAEPVRHRVRTINPATALVVD